MAAEEGFNPEAELQAASAPPVVEADADLLPAPPIESVPIQATAPAATETGAPDIEVQAQAQAAQPEAVAAQSPEAAKVEEHATKLVEAGKLDEKHAKELAIIPPNMAELVLQVLDTGHYSTDDIDFLLQFSEKELQEEIKHLQERDQTIDQLIASGQAEEDDRDELRSMRPEQVAKRVAEAAKVLNETIEGLIADGILPAKQAELLRSDKISEEQRQLILKVIRINPALGVNVDVLISAPESQLQAMVDVQQQKEDLAKRIKGEGEAGMPLNAKEKLERREQLDSAREEAASLAKQQLEYFGKGGEFDQTLKGLLKIKIIDEIDAPMYEAAQQAFAAYDLMPLDQIKDSVYLKPDGQKMSQAEYVNAYVGDQLDPKKHPQEFRDRRRRINEELHARVEAFRTVGDSSKLEQLLKEVDPQFKDKLVDALVKSGAFAGEQLLSAGKELAENSLNMDIFVLMRFLVHSDVSYQTGREGILGMEDGKVVRLIGEEDFMAKTSRPQEFGQSFALAMSRSEEMRREGFNIDPDVLKVAATGNPEAIRQVLTEALTYIFSASEADKEKRWKAFRQGVPEAMFIGVNARFDDKMKEKFEEIFDDIKSGGNQLELIFPDTEKQAVKDTQPKLTVVQGGAASGATQPTAAAA